MKSFGTAPAVQPPTHVFIAREHQHTSMFLLRLATSSNDSRPCISRRRLAMSRDMESMPSLTLIIHCHCCCRRVVAGYLNRAHHFLAVGFWFRAGTFVWGRTCFGNLPQSFIRGVERPHYPSGLHSVCMLRSAYCFWGWETLRWNEVE